MCPWALLVLFLSLNRLHPYVWPPARIGGRCGQAVLQETSQGELLLNVALLCLGNTQGKKTFLH